VKVEFERGERAGEREVRRVEKEGLERGDV
jgi:hypothetical protein